MSRRLQPQWLRQHANFIDPPLCPHPYDDEFESGTLDPSWTRTGPSGGTLFDDVNPMSIHAAFSSGGCRWALPGMPGGRRSYYMVQPQAGPVPGAAQVQIQKTVVVPSSCFMYSRMSFSNRTGSQPTNDAVIGIGLYQGVPFADGINVALNKGNLTAIQVTATRHVASVATTIGGSTGNENNKGQSFHTVAIQRDGTTYHCWALAAEAYWQWLGNITWNGTPDTAVIYFFNSSTTAPGNMILGVDFVRFSRTGLRT